MTGADTRPAACACCCAGRGLCRAATSNPCETHVVQTDHQAEGAPAARPCRPRPGRARAPPRRCSRRSAPSTSSTASRRSRRRSSNTPTRWENSCPTRTGRTRACSRSRTTTSSGCRLRYDLTAPLARYVAENFDAPAETLPQLPLRLGVPQREARAGPLPPVHAVRRRHGRRRQRRGRRRDLHDGRPTRWRRSASRAASTSSRSTTARCWTACWRRSASTATTMPGDG